MKLKKYVAIPFSLVLLWFSFIILNGSFSILLNFFLIDPRPDEIAVLISKTGKDLPSDQLLATSPDEKGIQLSVLSEGLYFRNPYCWDWEIHPVLDIPAGKLGVLTRLYGTNLPSGKIIAGENSKGILSEVLRPGKYRINPYAYHSQLFDATFIRPGAVGIVITLTGKDVLDNDSLSSSRNTFLVGAETKGVVPEVLDPGTYYLNPYQVNVVEVNLQSQRFQMGGEDAITFLTLDGFPVRVEGTIEFGIERSKAALLMHRVGDMEDVLRKVILPRARGFSRLEGSKYSAVNFIVGETRQKFQDNLEQHLREKTEDWGVAIKSVLIRNILVPDAIASVIREREVAVQNARKFEQQIQQARSKAELTRQEMLAQQNRKKVQAETARIRAVIGAEQNLSVTITDAVREREVARLENEAASFQATAILSKAEADRDVVQFDNQAQAAILAVEVKAMGSGKELARYRLYQKLSPRLKSILVSDDAGGLLDLLRVSPETNEYVPTEQKK